MSSSLALPLRSALSRVAVSEQAPAGVSAVVHVTIDKDALSTTRHTLDNKVVHITSPSVGESAALIEAAARSGLFETCAVIVTPALSVDDALSLARKLVLASYQWDRHITEAKRRNHRVGVYTIVASGVPSDRLERTLAIADGTCFVRDIGNLRPKEGNVAFYVALAKEIAAETGGLMTVEHLDHAALVAKGAGCIAAVGQGAPGGAALVLLDYRGNPDSAETSALVGKGIVFDSGGLDIKGSGTSHTMNMDMCGMGAVLGTAKTLAKLKAKVNFTAVLCLAENSVDANSYHPGDILTSFKGLSVEILNTDAEGRLALADGLAYVEKTRPGLTRVVDMATLTGAIVAALGDGAAGLFAPDDDFAAEMLAASKRSGDKVWHMPILPEHEEDIKSPHADIKNLGTVGKGGACTAAAFLKRFVECKKWAHVDIAGIGMSASKGASGFGVALMVSLLDGQGI